jgi:hypothetical protein
MPRSSATRHGSGAGYGGAKRGGRDKGEPPKVAGPGRPKGVKTGEGKAAVKEATFREVLAPHYAAIAEKWKKIALNDEHPHQHTMIIKAAELNQEFKQTVEHTGEGGGPVAIEWVIVDPASDRSA